MLQMADRIGCRKFVRAKVRCSYCFMFNWECSNHIIVSDCLVNAISRINHVDEVLTNPLLYKTSVSFPVLLKIFLQTQFLRSDNNFTTAAAFFRIIATDTESQFH